ncbi:GLUG motif-containing protein [Sedimentisphaera salicampi]|uniref:GLUG motif-containing protein n=1 Tax=Sedimentisphaera salicampi TaxID=1941349 RepID=UPI000B9B3B05|nr:GLUG motif-containing protein [Sedimentisphaera salicampi]OXU15671.1 hypothetical protein SMSP1_00568 [Sedimentisphaera salicampi]
MKNKVVVSLICVQFALCSLAGLSFGFAGGSGSSSDPYQISTKADLEAVTNSPAAHYILVNDIDLSTTTYDEAVISPNEASYWSSNYEGTPFTGSFDGAGFQISGLTIDCGEEDEYLGLFGKIDSQALIMDVKLVNVDVSGDDYVGALAGSSPSEVSNVIGCSATGGSVSASGNNLGGLIGCNHGFVQNCYSTLLVSGSATDAGGLIGENYNGTVTGCYTAGTLSCSNTYTGGLVGYAGGSSTITQSYSEMDVTGYAIVGSLVGQNRGIVSDCYAVGNANAAFTGTGCETGALVGFNYGSIQNCFSAGETADCLSSAAIAGCSYEDDISGCFWDTQTSGEDKAYTQAFDYTPVYSTVGVAEGKTTSQMQSKSTFTAEGWDFSSEDGDDQIWIMLPGSYPKLAVFGYEIEGDIDGSGEVNLDDLSMMAAEWLLAGDYAADINEDGMVDLEDYAALASYWQG